MFQRAKKQAFPQGQTLRPNGPAAPAPQPAARPLAAATSPVPAQHAPAPRKADAAEQRPNPPPAETTAATAASAPAEAAAAGGDAPSVISSDLTITGTLRTERDVQLNGRVDGDVRAARLLLGDKAVVRGDIYAREAVISGRVEGGVRARTVRLMRTAEVTGDIVHGGQLSMESGSYFEGSCRHASDPLADQKA